MGLGLHKASSAYQRTMEFTLSEVKLEFALVHLDDTVLLCCCTSKQIYHVKSPFSLSRGGGAVVKLEKCYTVQKVSIIRTRYLPKEHSEHIACDRRRQRPDRSTDYYRA